VENVIAGNRRVIYPLVLTVAAIVGWQATAFSPLAAACALGAAAVAAYSFARPAHVLWALLILKPLVDLTWRWPVITVGQADYNFQTVLGVFVAGLGLAHWAASWQRPRVDCWPLAALVFLMGISMVLRPDMAALSSFARLTSGLPFLLLAGIYATTAPQVRRLSVAILASLCVVIVIGYLQLAELVPSTWFIESDRLHLSRVSGGYEHHADLSRVLLVGHVLALMLLWQSRSWAARAALIVFLVAAYGVLIFSYHRMGWCVVLVELLVWLGLKRRAGLAFVVLAAVAAVALVYWDLVAELFRTLLFVFQSDTGLGFESFLCGRGHALSPTGHLYQWMRAGPLVYLLGFGTPQLRIEGLMYDQTDCDYLRVLVCYGAAGLALYMATLIWCFRQGVGLAREAAAAGQPFWRDWGLATITLTVTVALFGITTYSLNYPVLVWLFFAIVSISAAARRRLSLDPKALDGRETTAGRGGQEAARV